MECSSLEYLAQIERGIDFVEANLDRDLSPADVARHAGISQWHFQRIFKALTNETLKAYIRTRRFARSLEQLAGTRRRILEIAMDAGFDTQESFTRAFRKAFAVTPAQYRKQPGLLAFPKKVRFDQEYLRHIHTHVSLEPELIDRPAMDVVGMRTRYFGAGSEKNTVAEKLPRLWAEFLTVLNDVPHRIPGGGYGVMHQTEALSDELDYWAAVPVTHVDTLPPSLKSLRVPAARYASFAHRGKLTGLDRTVDYIYSSWLLRSGLRHTYGCDLEFYGEEYEPDSDASVIYYSIPVEG